MRYEGKNVRSVQGRLEVSADGMRKNRTAWAHLINGGIVFHMAE